MGRLHGWLRHHALIDLLGFGLGAALGIGFYIYYAYYAPNPQETTPLRDLWANAALEVLGVWLSVRIIDYLVRRRDKRLFEARWAPTRNITYARILDQVHIFIRGLAGGCSRPKETWYYFGTDWALPLPKFDRSNWFDFSMEVEKNNALLLPEVGSDKPKPERLAEFRSEVQAARSGLDNLLQSTGHMLEPEVLRPVLTFERALRHAEALNLLRESESVTHISFHIGQLLQAAYEVGKAVTRYATVAYSDREHMDRVIAHANTLASKLQRGMKDTGLG